MQIEEAGSSRGGPELGSHSAGRSPAGSIAGIRPRDCMIPCGRMIRCDRILPCDLIHPCDPSASMMTGPFWGPSILGTIHFGDNQPVRCIRKPDDHGTASKSRRMHEPAMWADRRPRLRSSIILRFAFPMDVSCRSALRFRVPFLTHIPPADPANDKRRRSSGSMQGLVSDVFCRNDRPRLCLRVCPKNWKAPSSP